MSDATTHETRERATARAFAGPVLLAWFALAGAAWASPQVATGQKTADRPCPGEISGYLGITGLNCPPCSVTIKRVSDRWQPAWSFAIEPTITEIAPGSPADGVLRVGDQIVGIDGMLITSAEGGRRLADIEPDQDVTLRYRRRGRSADVVLRARPRCGQFVEGMSTSPFTWSSVEQSLQLRDGVRIDMDDPAQQEITIALPQPRVAVAVPRAGSRFSRPQAVFLAAHLGIRWSCDGCTATMKEGRRAWTFSKPLRVTGVEVGGPADTAGVQRGDEITAVDGHPITSAKGGGAFGNARAGQPLQLTLRGTDGKERTVTIIPTDAPPEGAIKRSR